MESVKDAFINVLVVLFDVTHLFFSYILTRINLSTYRYVDHSLPSPDTDTGACHLERPCGLVAARPMSRSTSRSARRMSPSSASDAVAKDGADRSTAQRTSSTSAAAAGDTPEQRIARYKELRRQQLREGVAAVLDREKNAAKNDGERNRITSTRSAISRRTPRLRNEELSSAIDSSANVSTPLRVRTTRASRLRQAAALTIKSSPSPSTSDKSSNAPNSPKSTASSETSPSYLQKSSERLSQTDISSTSSDASKSADKRTAILNHNEKTSTYRNTAPGTSPNLLTSAQPSTYKSYADSTFRLQRYPGKLTSSIEKLSAVRSRVSPEKQNIAPSDSIRSQSEKSSSSSPQSGRRCTYKYKADVRSPTHVERRSSQEKISSSTEDHSRLQTTKPNLCGSTAQTVSTVQFGTNQGISQEASSSEAHVSEFLESRINNSCTQERVSSSASKSNYHSEINKPTDADSEIERLDKKLDNLCLDTNTSTSASKSELVESLNKVNLNSKLLKGVSSENLAVTSDDKSSKDNSTLQLSLRNLPQLPAEPLCDPTSSVGEINSNEILLAEKLVRENKFSDSKYSSAVQYSPVPGPSSYTRSRTKFEYARYGSEDNLAGGRRRISSSMGDHLNKKDKSGKRKNSFSMAPNVAVVDDFNGSRRSRRLTNSGGSSSGERPRRRSPQRSASLCKPCRPTADVGSESALPSHQDDRRVDALTARTKEALLKVERLKIRRVASSKVSDRKAHAMNDKRHQQLQQHEEDRQPKPISILKRKSGTCTLPVTFSPEVVLESEKMQRGGRQGILKKRLSMEEVTSVRQQADLRSRRSSLDITARTTHQGILKRRTSRSEDEDYEDSPGDSPPHGILKGGASTEDCNAMRPILKRRSHSEDHREQSRDSSPEPHHGILKKASDYSSGLSYSEGCLQYQLNQSFDQVKPILKKKSLSQDSTTASSLDVEIPRPILKKKSSTESDEADEYKPRRPILKSGSRTSSRRDSPRRDSPRTAVGFGENQALPQDLAAALNEVVQRRTSTGNAQNLQRAKSAAAADSELASILMKRRNMTDEQVVVMEQQQVLSNGSGSGSGSGDQRQTVVANSSDESDRPRNGSASPTQMTESIAERISRLVGGASASGENGAVPRRRAADRFRTQPVTFNEMVALNELNAYREVQGKVKNWSNMESENLVQNDPESDDSDVTDRQTERNSASAIPSPTRATKSATSRPVTTKLKEAIRDDGNMLSGSCSRVVCQNTSIACDKPRGSDKLGCDKHACSDSPIDEGVASDLSSDEGRTARENNKNLELTQKKDDADRKRKMTRTERMLKSCRIDDVSKDGASDVRSKLELLLKKGGPLGQSSPTGGGGAGFVGRVSQQEENGGEVRKVGRNDAVARRRQANAARKEINGRQSPSALVKTKSSSSITLVCSNNRNNTPGARQPQAHAAKDECDDDGRSAFPLFHGLRRSLTQPLREPSRKSSDEEDNEMPGGATIAERLAALQKSGQNDWRKRVSRLAPDEDVSAIISRDIGKPLKQEPLLSSAQPACILQPPPSLQQQHNQINAQQQQIIAQQDSGAAILAERLECLETASQGWRRRVAPADAGKFSVAGRMPAVEKSRSMLAVVAGGGGATAGDQRKRRCPPMNRFRSRTAMNSVSATNASATGPSSATQLTSTVSGAPFKRSISAPGGPEQDLNTDSGGVSVSIPRTDDETFNAFFLSATETPPPTNSAGPIESVDLDAVSKDSRQMLVLRRTVQAQRGRRAGSRNPVRALAQREDLRDSYAEVRTDVADRELKRMKVEKLAKGSSMAVEALAGLASKEDFTAVNLRKAAANGAAQSFNMLPHKPLMLIQVKGRRHVQARLVEPVAASINSGDAYVLITPEEVFLYLGLYSNVIERSRGADIVQCIQQKKDLGCSGTTKVYTINEEKLPIGQHVKKFWSLLGWPEGSTGKAIKAGHPDEDELYEAGIVDTNMAYELQGDELVPLEKYWGGIPRISMLDPSKILVFDFGSEMYVWNGKTASMDDRKNALKLAQELWAEGYDYSNCDVCPLNVTELLGDRGMRDDDVIRVKKNIVRPEWALIGKINQHMETVLFREKFLDWPDFSRVIQSKTLDNGEEKNTDGSIDLSPCNARAMIESKPPLPSLKLENDEVGRGDFHFNEELGRRCEITTVKVTMWRVQEYKSSELDDTKLGHFYSGDGYVVRWQYLVSVTGRELGGKPSRHSLSGRDRCAYFCWQGRNATNIDKGAAALLTVQLDKERGPQIRVAQGREPPAFANLFSGGMMVHEGKRGETRTDRYRLYTCKGCVQNEAVLEEVPCSMRQLRSRSSLVLVDTENNAVIVWHGARSFKHVKEVARAAATKLQSCKPLELFSNSVRKVSMTEITEGNETSVFLEALGGCNRKLYVSMIKATANTFDYTPRLFHLSSVSGTFEPMEVLCPLRHETLNTPFPFSQSDLYSASQPAIFLLDNESALWLWQGWWPPGQDKDDETDGALLGSDQTGSGAVRWQAERRAAMQTAVDYWKVKHGSAKDVKGYLVWAGLEPLEFTNLFPVWLDRDDIAEINMKEGKKAGEPVSLQGQLSQLTCSTYHPDILLQRPLPEGVDPTRLELYLEPRYFKELLGLTKEEFNELPTWKQTKVKKEKGLF